MDTFPLGLFSLCSMADFSDRFVWFKCDKFDRFILTENFKMNDKVILDDFLKYNINMRESHGVTPKRLLINQVSHYDSLSLESKKMFFIAKINDRKDEEDNQ